MQPISIAEIRKTAEQAFASGLNCAESVALALSRAQGRQTELLPRMATAFGGGMARTCSQCGALSGGIMGLSLALGRRDASGSVDAAYTATQQLIGEFEAAFGSRSCRDLLGGVDLGTPEGQAAFKERNLRERCAEFTGTTAEAAARILLAHS